MEHSKFISERMERGLQALEKFETGLTGLSRVQLNWKPFPRAWSIAECLDHLIIADHSYFQDLRAISQGKYRMTWWERYSPLSGILGKALVNQMQEEVGRKMTTPVKLEPGLSEYEPDILDRYRDNLTQLMELVSACGNVDSTKYVINSPTIPWITYSLRDALEFLLEHEHRHLNQAIRVKDQPGFPAE